MKGSAPSVVISPSQALICASNTLCGVRSDVDLVLVDQLLQIVRILTHRQPLVGGRRSLGGVLQDRLLFLRERVELGAVEHDLEVLGRLVMAAEHVVLRHVLRTEALVRGRIVELEGIDHAALHGRHDFAARKLRDGHAHRLHQIGRETDGAVLQALHAIRRRPPDA